MPALHRTLLSALLVFTVGAASAHAATAKHKQGDVSFKLAKANTAKVEAYLVRQHPGATYEQPKPCRRLTRRQINCYILEHRTVAGKMEKVQYTTSTRSTVGDRKTTFITSTTAGEPQPDD